MKTKLNDLFYSEWNVDPFSLCINIFRYKWFDNDTGKGLLHTPIKRLIFHCQLLRWSVYFHFLFQWHISFVYIREFGLPQVACGCQVGHAHTADLMEKRGHVLTQRGERLTHFGQTRNRLQEKVNSLLVLQHCKKLNIFGLFSSQYVSKVKLYDYQKKQMKTTCWTIISLITDTNTDPDTKVTTLVKLDLDRDKWPLTSNNLINSFHFDLAMYLIYKVLNQWEKLFKIFLRRIDKSHTNIPNILYYNLNVLPSMTIMVYMALLPPIMVNMTLMHSLATLRDLGRAYWQHRWDISLMAKICRDRSLLII